MAFEQKISVAEISTTTGTGAYALGGALSGRRAFSVHADGATVLCRVTMGTDWEYGRYTFASGANTLTRTAVLKSTNSNNAVNWSAGTKTIREVSEALSDVDATTLTGLRLLLGLAIGTNVAAAGANTDLTSLAAMLTAPLYAPRGHLAGLGLSNNGTDATNDIDIAAGSARDGSNALNITLDSALTKRLDANWAVGTSQGGRYSGAAIADTTYHVYAACKAAGANADVYFHPYGSSDATVLSHLQAETGGSAYAYVRRIGSILRESSAIVAFIQTGDRFLRSTPVLDVSANNPGASAVTRTLSIPLGVKLDALLNAGLQNSGTGVNAQMYLSSLDVADVAPSLTAAPLGQTGSIVNSSGGTRYNFLPVTVGTNTSAQIRSRLLASDASVTLYIATLGWIDTRGRLD